MAAESDLWAGQYGQIMQQPIHDNSAGALMALVEIWQEINWKESSAGPYTPMYVGLVGYRPYVKQKLDDFFQQREAKIIINPCEYTTTQAAKILGVKDKTVTEYIREGKGAAKLRLIAKPGTGGHSSNPYKIYGLALRAFKLGVDYKKDHRAMLALCVGPHIETQDDLKQIIEISMQLPEKVSNNEIEALAAAWQVEPVKTRAIEALKTIAKGKK